MEDFLNEHLKLWKDEGIPAPVNELQSIQGWLRCLVQNGAEETADIMRKRILLLGQAAIDLHKAGPEAEDKVGIYENRPDLRPE
jgi:hypothetical protein